ncbi:MAG: YfiR family protein [Bryobacteraceae bacterium]
MPRIRTLGRIGIALLILGLFARGQSVRSIRQGTEAEIKAAFLINFAKFVEWPSETSPGNDFTICVAGADPFGQALDRAVENEAIENKPVKVRYVPRWQNDCRILFVGASDLDNSQFLAGVPPGVLTVGEQPSFLLDGGMIALVMEDQRVRFEVNLRAANRSSVHISSKLLDVARRVQK